MVLWEEDPTVHYSLAPQLEPQTARRTHVGRGQSAWQQLKFLGNVTIRLLPIRFTEHVWTQNMTLVALIHLIVWKQ